MTTIDLFAGPGGWDEGARSLGVTDIIGFDTSADACATAVAAGHRRNQGDVRELRFSDWLDATGLIASPPCPTFSPSGLRSGLGDDYQAVLDVWTSIGWGAEVDQAMSCVDDVADPRTALLALAGAWALALPNLCWLAMEQVHTVEFAWEDLSAELFGAGWEWADVLTIDAADFGLGSRRRRSYLLARRHSPSPNGFALSRKRSSMAATLGWPSGHEIVTRGNRRPTGGNRFSADKPAWCLTGSSRSWERDDGIRLTAAEAGQLVGFRPDYPWQGSRSSQFLQAADAVSPVMAAGILSAALGAPNTTGRPHDGGPVHREKRTQPSTLTPRELEMTRPDTTAESVMHG